MNTALVRILGTTLALSTTAMAACGSSQSQTSQSTSSSASSSGGGATTSSTASTASDSTASTTADAPAATASPAPTASTAPASEAPPAGPVVADAPMRVQSQAGATGWFARIDIERRDDGALLFAGQEIGRMNAGRITTLDGQVVPLQGRLSIGVRGRREHLEMQPDGSVVMDAGRLTVDPSGDVQITRGTTTRPTRIHITGYRAETATLAAILLAYGIMKADLATR